MIKMTFRLEHPDYDSLTKSELTSAHNAGAMSAQRYMLAQRIDRRFDGSMQAQLGWSPRNGRYDAVKARVKKRGGISHNFSGRTRGMARRSKKIFMTRKRMGVEMILPGYYRRSRKIPNLHNEIMRISREELADIKLLYGKAYVNVIKNPRKVKLRITG